MQLQLYTRLDFRVPIDVEEAKPKKSKPPKKWIPDLGLLDCDRSTLLSPVGWINDSLVNASQELLKKQFPDLCGLQDTAMGYIMNYKIAAGEFIQILHPVNNHWLIVANIGLKHPNVAVFDSLYETMPLMVQAQIACLLSTKEDTIEVCMMDVQRQVNEPAVYNS